jgi:nucleotide-binding universal stress UspA family protein
MKRILVPTDFSECAYEATKVAAEIASQTEATLYLLHIIDIPLSETNSNIGMVNTDIPEAIFLMKHTKQQFETLLKDKIFEKVTRVIESVDFSGTYDKVIEKANELEIDLIVMGSHGSKGVKEFLIGSNTERVINLASCPVLAVKKYQPINSISNIVFASDFSNEAINTYNDLMPVFKIFNSKLHLLKITTPLNFEPSYKSMAAIKSFVEKLNMKDVIMSTYADYSEEEGIQHYADEVNAGVIAIGTHARSGLGQFFRGNLAARLVNHSDKIILSKKIN